MATSIIPSIGINVNLILFYLGWGFVIICFTALLSLGIIMLMIKKKSTKFIELNLSTKKAQTFFGKYRKQKRSGVKSLWVGKIKKYLPNIQQEDIYNEKGKDLVLLFKDNNGLHHTARLPTHEELKKWYLEVHDIDIDELEEKRVKKKDGTIDIIKIPKYSEKIEELKTMYLIPNPSEDLDWLGTQCAEADKEFVGAWWQHPTFMLLGTVAICGFIFIISLIVTAKMT